MILGTLILKQINLPLFEEFRVIFKNFFHCIHVVLKLELEGCKVSCRSEGKLIDYVWLA